MADSKITALTSISTSTDPANDPLVIVDVSDTSMAASGTTKKVTLNNLLACSPTATLASATITGDLTVDVSTLKVDSANNRVGIGTASPARPLDIVGSFQSSLGWVLTGTPAGLGAATRYIGGASTTDSWYYNGLTGGSHIWAFGESTAMTLNATGLGVGVASPNDKLTVIADSYLSFQTATTTFNSGRVARIGAISAGSGNGYLVFETYKGGSGGGERMRIDSDGNVGIGVTPSASWVTYKALEFDTGIVSGSSSMALNRNCYFDGVNWRYKVTTSFGIAQYQLSGNGNHIWNIASSGSAGAAINGGTGAWTQAMTLDASGNLMVGKAASLFSTVGFEASQTGFLSLTNSASTNAATNLSVYSTGAAAFRFYVGLAGTVFATNTTISAISDARLKENVQDLDVGLDAILALKPRKFDWKAGKGKDIKGDRGFIAQEFETVFPNLIDEWKDEAPEGEAPYKSVRQDLIPVLVKAIQELTARVQTLEAK